MVSQIPNPCMSCRWYDDKNACTAFASGIPDDILVDGHAHDTVRRGQTAPKVWEVREDRRWLATAWLRFDAARTQ